MRKQTIFKTSKRDQPFIRVLYPLIDDNSISWRARAILIYLIGKPQGWKLRIKDLQNHGTDRRDAIRAALDQLQDRGYVKFEQGRAAAGHFEEGVWLISDRRIFQESDAQRETGEPEPEKPEPEKPLHSKKGGRKRKKNKKKEKRPGSAGISSSSSFENKDANAPDSSGFAAEHGNKEHEPDDDDVEHDSSKKGSPKIPDSRKSDDPEKEKLLPVLERWREVYEIVQGSPYVESRKDMEALSHLLHRWPDADQLASVIESAFLLVGHPKAWTCNNRMETIDAFAVNIAKIMGEVKKHAALPEAQHRMELVRRERLWAARHQQALEYLQGKFGADVISHPSPKMLEFLRGHDDLGEVPAYFRCLLSHKDPEVMLTQGAAAIGELDDHNMEGFVGFLKYRGWLIDLAQFGGREIKSPDDVQGLSGDESSAEKSSIHNAETNSASITSAQRPVSDPGPMPPIPTEWSLGDVDAPKLSAPTPTSACAGGLPEASRQPSSCGLGPMPPIPLQPSSVDPGKMPPIPPSH